MTTNTYLIKALDNYPYNMEECVESLGYAISYEDQNPIALCLMGRIQFEVLKNKTDAIDYFHRALAADVNYTETYFYFLNVLIEAKQLEKAEKLIEFALKIEGIDLGMIAYQKVKILERSNEFKKALKQLKEAIINTYDSDMIEDLEIMKTRIEKKIALVKKTK